MKRIIPAILLLAIIFSFGAYEASAAAGELSILFTHDLHSHIDTITEADGSETGGFAKIKTLIDEARSENPATLVVDAGDFSMGSIYQSAFAKEALELRLLGMMGYDAVTLGNHEFDYTAKGLYEMLRAAKAGGGALPLLTVSNIDWDSSTGVHTEALKQSMAEYGAEFDYAIIEKGGIRIAIFGLMGKDADDCAPTSGLIFRDISERAKEIVTDIELNADADIIVCLSHSGTEEKLDKSEDVILAKKVPGIDVIISGHSHTILEEPVIVGSTSIVSCGEYGKQIGALSLRQERDGKWKAAGYKLLKVDTGVEQDKGLQSAIAEFSRFLDEYVEIFGYSSTEQVIAYNPFDFPTVEEMQQTQSEQPLGNLISDSYLYAVKQAEGNDYVPIDAAIVPVGVIRASFKKGELTVNDIYEVSSLGIGEDGLSGYPLVSVYLTGAELKTVAEVDASVSVIMKTAQLYSSGLNYSFNPKRLLLNRVTEVFLTDYNGERNEIEDEKLYRVVAGMYSAQMLGTVEGKSFGLLKLTPKDESGSVITDFTKHIIRDRNNAEVKEWYALCTYLDSFPEVNGVSVIPDEYGAELGRKLVQENGSLPELLKNPNKIFFILTGVILLLAALLILLAFLIVRRVRKRKAAR